MVKQEKDVFKKDLSKAEGSYTKELGDHIAEINSKFMDESVTPAAYMEFIAKAIERAHDTPAKRNFLAKLSGQRNKYGMLNLATQAYLKGCGLEAI